MEYGLKMTDEEKKELVYLLQVYMHDLLSIDKSNQKYKDSDDKWLWYQSGVKAQYNHARCIEKKLAVEVEDMIYAE